MNEPYYHNQGQKTVIKPHSLFSILSLHRRDINVVMFEPTPDPHLFSSAFVPPGVDEHYWTFPQYERVNDFEAVDFVYLASLLFNLDVFQDLSVFWLAFNHLRPMMTHMKFDFIEAYHKEDMIEIVYPVLKLIRWTYLTRMDRVDIFNSTQNLLNQLVLRYVPCPSISDPKGKLLRVMWAWEDLPSLLSLRRTLLAPGVQERLVKYANVEVKIPSY